MISLFLMSSTECICLKTGVDRNLRLWFAEPSLADRSLLSHLCNPSDTPLHVQREDKDALLYTVLWSWVLEGDNRHRVTHSASCNNVISLLTSRFYSRSGRSLLYSNTGVHLDLNPRYPKYHLLTLEFFCADPYCSWRTV